MGNNEEQNLEFEMPIDGDKMQAIKDIARPHTYMLDDRFVIKDGKKHKCAIICPGGGYELVCSFIEGVPFAKRLNKAGISAIIVYYRTAKNAHFPNPQDDLAKAVKAVFELKDTYNLDMDGYSVWGSSAGGHLAASFGTSSMGYKKYGLPKPGSMVLIYPVITMDKTFTHMGTHDNLIGADAGVDEEKAKSIELNVDSDYPDTFIWCGDSDQTVPPKNTKVMAEALEANGIPYQCEIYPGVDHGVGPGTGTNAEGWVDKAIEFMLAR